jgi:hypothetical protein
MVKNRNLLRSALSSRRNLLALVFIVGLFEVAMLYWILPGRAPRTFTAVQPDSTAYICYGLQIAGQTPERMYEVSSEIFNRFGYPEVSCLSPSMSTNLPWLIYPRVLVSGFIALFSFLPISGSILIPSSLFFFLLLWFWFDSVVPRVTSLSFRHWVVAVAPLAAFTMIIWPASVLTDGPMTMLSLCGVLAIVRLGRKPRSWLVVFIIGFLMLLTRQSWPVVGCLWGLAIFGQIGTYLGSSSRILTSNLTRALVALVGGYSGAILLAKGLELVTVPPGLKETQPYVPEGMIFSLGTLANIVSSSLSSTFVDLIDSIRRGDLVSPILFFVALVSIILVLRMRAFGIASYCVVLLGFGLYSVGLVSSYDGAVNTHLRYLVPGMLASIAAFCVIDQRPVALQPEP